MVDAFCVLEKRGGDGAAGFKGCDVNAIWVQCVTLYVFLLEVRACGGELITNTYKFGPAWWRRWSGGWVVWQPTFGAGVAAMERRVGCSIVGVLTTPCFEALLGGVINS